jgi:tRNA A-37 threonylcarbamoyl transferase component Bud32
MTDDLDIERPADLMAYMREHRLIESHETPQIQTLCGGVSNRTVLVERGHVQDGGKKGWVFKQALEKLRVKADWFSSPERIHREALGLRWLLKLAPLGTITPLIFEDHQHPILAMEAVPQPHENWKTLLLRGDLLTSHVTQFGELLGSIHRASEAQSAELKTIFADVSFFESLRLEPYYGFSASQVPQAADFLNRLIAQTRESRSALVHGDYSPKNILVYENRLVLLDHEVIHWGDPAFDVGFAMAHFLSKAHHLIPHRSAFASAAELFWKSYANNSCEQRAVLHTLGCLLARVAGRSPLEYLNEDERVRQQNAVLKLISLPPVEIGHLIERFVACL